MMRVGSIIVVIRAVDGFRQFSPLASQIQPLIAKLAIAHAGGDPLALKCALYCDLHSPFHRASTRFVGFCSTTVAVTTTGTRVRPISPRAAAAPCVGRANPQSREGRVAEELTALLANCHDANRSPHGPPRPEHRRQSPRGACQANGGRPRAGHRRATGGRDNKPERDR